jgi:hypothetical protein
MTVKILVSYGEADRVFAERLGADMRALGAEVISDVLWNRPGANWDQALRDALEATDAFVLLVPVPGSPKANNAFFEAGAARASGKRVVAVLPTTDPSRARELPSEINALAIFDGSRLAPEALAKSIVTTLEAA